MKEIGLSSSNRIFQNKQQEADGAHGAHGADDTNDET